MKVFYIDTSSSYLYAGIAVDKFLVASIKKNFGKDLSKYTISEIAKLFQEASLEPEDIDKIIVVSGPGSFTGIRIGMTFAKIFAWSLKKDITTITSLDAMALVDTDKLVVPIIDARRGFVYTSIHEKDKIILKNQYIKLDSLIAYLDNLKKEYLFVTNQDNFDLPSIKYDPDILKIINTYQDKPSINPHLVEPTYLKLTEAEENLRNIHHDN